MYRIDFLCPLQQNVVSCPKTPDQWLEETASEKKNAASLSFLGYAPGVGKTYSMLSEAIRRKSRGEDVVIGVIEAHGRGSYQGFDRPSRNCSAQEDRYKGTPFEEMDVDAIIARSPQVALIDELAHTNIDGSKHHKRYEDVFELLDSNIDVLSTMNVQHLESVTPMVQKIPGVVVRETVPDRVLKRVDEIVLADVTPEALLKRIGEGISIPWSGWTGRWATFFVP